MGLEVESIIGRTTACTKTASVVYVTEVQKRKLNSKISLFRNA
jgi:hypothetical protein